MPTQGAGEGAQLTAGLRFACTPDVSALEAALSALAGRHNLLRTRFARSGSLIKQVTQLALSCTQLALSWTLSAPGLTGAFDSWTSHLYAESTSHSLHDVPESPVLQVLGSSGVSVQRKEVSAGKDVMAALQAEAEIPLDPSEEGGVLRATLLDPRVNGSTQPILALTLHAVAGAEPSLALLQSQLLAVYAGARAGGQASIRPGLQFRDVLFWLSQRQEQGMQSLSFHCTSGSTLSLVTLVWPVLLQSAQIGAGIHAKGGCLYGIASSRLCR